MECDNGTWVMYGVEWDDPECIHSVEEAIEYIEQIGFLPLFRNDIPGFSLEERTVAEYWWCENPQFDPWMWREIIARSGRVAYGKFFDKKAGFISLKWLPVFANYRRDGYDFDSLYEDGKAPMKHHKIMKIFEDMSADDSDVNSSGLEESAVLSNQLKQMAGFGKGGEKGFEGAITALMMELYLCNCDFRKRRNKKGEEYGWNVAMYTTPECMWGYDAVTACYKEEPSQSWQRIVNHMHDIYPIATDRQIMKVLK